MDIRHSQLVLISKRVEAANDKINEILRKLNWTRQELKQWHNERKKLQACPFDKRHLVPECNMREHYHGCLLKSRGVYYDANNNKKKKKKSISSVSLPSSSMFFYKQSPSVISFVVNHVDHSTQSQNIIDTNLIPQLQSQQQQKQEYYVKELEPLSSITEKCQTYDQVIQKSNHLKRHHHKGSSVVVVNQEIDRLVYEKQKAQKKKLREEQLQLDKRRRKQYRIKMKMTTPTEIQRELIRAYMEEYKQCNKK